MIRGADTWADFTDHYLTALDQTHPRAQSVRRQHRLRPPSTPDCGARVIEILTTGIPTVTRALTEAGLPSAHYIDAGIRFTVVLQRPHTTDRAGGNLNETQLRVYDALATGERTVAQLQEQLNLTAPNIRKALREPRDQGPVQRLGGRGRTTTYRRPAG